jgi:hypothetical protein
MADPVPPPPAPPPAPENRSVAFTVRTVPATRVATRVTKINETVRGPDPANATAPVKEWYIDRSTTASGANDGLASISIIGIDNTRNSSFVTRLQNALNALDKSSPFWQALAGQGAHEAVTGGVRPEIIIRLAERYEGSANGVTDASDDGHSPFNSSHNVTAGADITVNGLFRIGLAPGPTQAQVEEPRSRQIPGTQY